MSQSDGPVIVVGGGVIGIASAYFLARSGRQVTLLDRGEIGAGCSDGNCGLLCPSHVLPLAEPGALPTALKALLKPNSAFSIKPRWDPKLWIWLLQFAMKCNAADAVAAGRARKPLLEHSLDLYKQLIEDESMDC